jgi:hypothetical protein
MKKILPSQLTYEELMEVMNSQDDYIPPVEQITDYFNDIVPFLTNYGITPGETPVSKKLLYKLYKTYSKNPATNQEFQTKVGEYIVARSDQYYYINQDNFAISKHIYKETKKIEKTKSLTYQKHFQWFLDNRVVERGHKWVEGFILFYIYKTFCKERRVNPRFGYKSFHKFLKLHFTFKRIRENRSLWFRVDGKTHDLLSEEENNVIRESRKKETGRSQEESSKESETPT